jgi:hypothetical protein
MEMVTSSPNFIGADNSLVIIPVAYILVKVFRVCGDFIGITQGILVFDSKRKTFLVNVDAYKNVVFIGAVVKLFASSLYHVWESLTL